jgi:hypothetical protein
MANTSNPPKLLGSNLLRSPGVTVSVSLGGTNAVFPLDRLTDGDPTLLWKGSVITGTNIRGDQGPLGAEAVGGWGMTGHNLAGVALTVATSPDDSTYTTRDTYTPPDGGVVGRVFAGGPVTARYVRLHIPSMAMVPEIGELLFSLPLTLPRRPTIDGRTQNEVGNNLRNESIGAAVHRVIQSPTRWEISYTFKDFDNTHRDALTALYRALQGGAYSFILLDDEDVPRYVEWPDAHLPWQAAPGVLLHNVSVMFREAL